MEESKTNLLCYPERSTLPFFFPYVMERIQPLRDPEPNEFQGLKTLVSDLVFDLLDGDACVIERVQDDIRRVLIAKRKTA